MADRTRQHTLIIGGGPAGAAAAIHLARAGRNVTLIEKESAAHDKVCGEFLSHECLGYLSRLGIDPAKLGAVPIDTIALARKGAAMTAALPFKAQSLSRRVLDEALLLKAASTGAIVRRGVRVTALENVNGTWSAALDSGETVTAPDVILATGKHDLRGWKRPPGRQDDLIGFKMYWRLAPDQSKALERQVELALFPGGYAGLEPVEGGRANLCLLVRKSQFARLGNSWEQLLETLRATSAHLRMRLDGAEPGLPRPLAIASIPYGYVLDQITITNDPQPWRLGDQAAVIPSFSGDGMSIALHSAHVAANMMLAGQRAEAFHHQIAHDVSRQIARATRVSQALVTPWGQTAAVALSSLFPSLMTGTATLTRIPERALNRAEKPAL